MNIQIECPAQTKTKRVSNIRFDIENNIAIVELWDTQRNRIKVDINPVIKELTLAKQKTIRDFLSKIISIASGINIEDVPDEILKEEIVEKIIETEK